MVSRPKMLQCLLNQASAFPHHRLRDIVKSVQVRRVFTLLVRRDDLYTTTSSQIVKKPPRGKPAWLVLTCNKIWTNNPSSLRNSRYSLALPPAVLQPNPSARLSCTQSWQTVIMSPRLPNVRATSMAVMDGLKNKSGHHAGVVVEAIGGKCGQRLTVEVRRYG